MKAIAAEIADTELDMDLDMYKTNVKKTKFSDWLDTIIRTKYASPFLYFFSFIESIFFPIPTDCILVPVSIYHPKKWLRIALLTALFSLLGGLIGYFIGKYFFEWLNPYIIRFGYETTFDKIYGMFVAYGALIVFAAGFTPLPFKIFTIVSGVFGVNIFIFIVAAFISRFLRYVIISFLCAKAADKYKDTIYKLMSTIGWIVLLLIIVLITILFCMKHLF